MISPNPNDVNKYTASRFFSTIQAIVTDVEQHQSHTTGGGGISNS